VAVPEDPFALNVSDEEVLECDLDIGFTFPKQEEESKTMTKEQRVKLQS